MSSHANNRRREPGKASNEKLILGVALTAIAAVAVVWISMTMGSRMDGVNPDLTRDPFEMISGLLRGTLVWPTAATLIAAACAAVVVLIGIWVLWMRAMRRKGRTSVDRAAPFMAPVREISHMQGKQAQKKSERLGVTGNPGIPVGATVVAGKPLYASFEDMMIVIAGPRVGKSTSLVIPALLSAPGAVVSTSNKRDVLDATRDVRSAAGPVWVFDPQRVALEEPTWWWNPLSYVTDDTKAEKLAQHFAAGSKVPGAKEDAFFDPKGQSFLAGLLLAAAVGNRPISQVYSWLTNVSDEDPVNLLEDAGYALMADGVAGVQRSTEKLRDSVYQTAEKMAACLKNSAIHPWVNPAVGGVDAEGNAIRDPRPQFSPTEFVTGAGTLYSLSKEGTGTAGPLVTALTAATIEAAEEHAANSRGGRLQTPLLGILDEAANVCRWTDLPDLYSHFGSRGIPIMSVFQSWSQGIAVFGREGMRKLWSASNVKLYAGGVSETDFLGEMSELVGTYDRETSSVSYNKGVRSTSTSLKRERILEVQELADLPRGRAVMFSSGSRATLVKTVPWYEGPHAAAIKASIAAHEPGARV